MAEFPCPYCGQSVAVEADEQSHGRCPSCDGGLHIAFRYRLERCRGTISGGVLYEARDDIFGGAVAVLFVEDPDDREAVDRFVEGNRLFAELGGGRGLVKVRELANRGDRRPYVVIDWLAAGTLDSIVRKRGPLDQATLVELVGDLLTGLTKAHRSMPSVIHGHIHPGKIGFLSGDEIVLFGFEWARQVFEQDSHLADAFVTGGEVAESGRAADMQQLGVSVFYAATGEWLADLTIEQKRARVRGRMQGPLGVLVDRMLGAGADGYRSAVDAQLDFDDLLRGTSSFTARNRHVQDRTGDLVSSAWSRDAKTATGDAYAQDERFNATLQELFDEDEDDDDDDDGEVLAAPAEVPVRGEPAVTWAQQQGAIRQAEARARPQAPAAPAAKAKANPGKVIGALIGVMFMFSMCVVGIVDDMDDMDDMDGDSDEPAPRVRGVQAPPIVNPPPVQPIELPAAPELDFDEPQLAVGELSGVHRYVGSVTGPPDHAGIPLATACDVWVEGAGTQNCKWYIDCGEPRRRIYGGESVGYSPCVIVDGHPVSGQDEDQDAPDGAFMAMLSDNDPMVIVQDRWLKPPTRVLIGVEGGGLTTDAIPDTPLAPRWDGEHIEAAIARGQLPAFEAAGSDDVGDAAESDDDAQAGGLSRSQVRAGLDALDERLALCNAAGGRVKVEIEIQPDGSVSAVEFTPPRSEDEQSCLVEMARSVRFPAFRGDPMTVSWPTKL